MGYVESDALLSKFKLHFIDPFSEKLNNETSYNNKLTANKSFNLPRNS